MGYYGASAYRGDYYGQGDYYPTRRGDPGFFDFVSDVGSGIANVAKAALPIAAPLIGTAFGGPLGGVVGGALGSFASKVLAGGPPIRSPAPMPLLPPPAWTATAPGTGSTAAMIPATPRSFSGVSIGGPKGLVAGKTMYGGRAHLAGVRHHRRMNPLNPRALGRALRRASGFRKYATKVLKLCGEKRHVDGFKMPRKKRR